MKKSIILGVIAITLIVLYTTTMTSAFLPLIIILLMALFYAIVMNEFFRRRRGINAPKPFECTVDDLTTEFGEPEDVILVKATRANEALGVILAYKDFFIVEGRRIEKTDIKDVSFNNSGTPYTPGEYQIIIVVGPSRSDCIHVNAGFDAAWARDVVGQIKKNL